MQTADCKNSALLPIEVKAGATVASDSFKGLRKWAELAEDAAEAAWLLYGTGASQQKSGTPE